MPLYHFDTRDNGALIQDDVGTELADLDAARQIATASLAELAMDVLPGSERRVLIVEVREGRQPVLEARLTFEAVHLTH
jgi:hypothetical protein